MVESFEQQNWLRPPLLSRHGLPGRNLFSFTYPDYPDVDAAWLFEVKHDGFRALAHVEGHRCWLVSRRGHVFTKWDGEEIAHSARAMSAG